MMSPYSLTDGNLVSMTMDAAHIENLIRIHLPDARIDLSDVRGDGHHFAARITSPAFAGKTRIEQHRMVYRALVGCREEDLESLSIQTFAPDQREQKNKK